MEFGLLTSRSVAGHDLVGALVTGAERRLHFLYSTRQHLGFLEEAVEIIPYIVFKKVCSVAGV